MRSLQGAWGQRYGVGLMGARDSLTIQNPSERIVLVLYLRDRERKKERGGGGRKREKG